MGSGSGFKRLTTGLFLQENQFNVNLGFNGGYLSDLFWFIVFACFEKNCYIVKKMIESLRR
jgi:hypothetical protein